MSRAERTQLDDRREPIVDAPLDPVQLGRIEAVHRGYLYQHLYAVGCLLLADKASVQHVIVERDEDIELALADEHVYIQVKNRSHALIESDIEGAIERFDILRRAHADGSRAGRASFYIISSSAPGPKLGSQLELDGWPTDVTVLWPDKVPPIRASLPPAWTGVSAALAWCSLHAGGIPLGVLSPDTLVKKLSMCVMLASSGTRPYVSHSFAVAQLAELFEQLVVQLQDFPMAPTPYRSQLSEPALQMPDRLRAISGFSGAGKTAWAAQALPHAAGRVAYFDATNIPGPALPLALAREVAARFLDRSNSSLREIFPAGALPLDALRAIDHKLGTDSEAVLVVIDNAHLLPKTDLRTVVTATKSLRFLLLCQPNAALKETLAFLRIEEERLHGWSLDTIANEISEAGGRANVPTCQSVRDITGGLPLYVQSIARVASAQYDGDVAALCEALKARTNVAETAQEAILDQLFGTLDEEERNILAVLSEAECTLTDAEAATIAKAVFGMKAETFSQTVRRLTPTGTIQFFGHRRLKVHDALCLVCKTWLTNLGEPRVASIRAALCGILKTSLASDADTAKGASHLRLLCLTGNFPELISRVQGDLFHEKGLAPTYKDALKKASLDEGLDPVLRFDALDTLVFMDLQRNEVTDTAEHLEEMTKLVQHHRLGVREQMSLRSKELAFAHAAGRELTLKELREAPPEFAAAEPENLRIWRYSQARELHLSGENQSAAAMCLALIETYCEHLGIDNADLAADKGREIEQALVRRHVATGLIGTHSHRRSGDSGPAKNSPRQPGSGHDRLTQ